MGFFRSLFGGGPRKPPAWARGFSDGARFDAWCDVVAAALADAGYPASRDDVRSGSVQLGSRATLREWILHTPARDCAAREPSEWPALVEGSLRRFLSGESGDLDRPVGAASGKRWIIGTAAWGGVLFECGATEVVLVVLPIVDRAPLAELPAFPPRMIRAIVVCNARDDGHLAATAIAKASGLDEVYAMDPAKPVDRGGPAGTSVAVVPFESLAFGALSIEREGTNLRGGWRGASTFLCGDAVPMALLGKHEPDEIVGMVDASDLATAALSAEAMLKLRRVLLVGNVASPYDPLRLGKALGRIGLRTEAVNLPEPAEAEPADTGEPPLRRALAHLLLGELDRADAVAAEAIERGVDAPALRHQRAMIALMRGDEDAARAQLEQIDTPQARSSLTVLLARKGDRAALDLAQRVLDELPEDAIAIRSMISAYVLLGELEHARAALALHEDALDPLVAAALERTIDDPSPPATGGHYFPELARLAMDVAAPMIDDKRYAQAEAILRRAAAWDPENHAVVAELGVCLSQQERDGDAIALYDEAIARGGYGRMLHFNRGNCRLRTSRFADAADDFRACLALWDDWNDARVSLCSASFAAGDTRTARAQLAELRARGATEHVPALEKMLAAR